MQTTLLVLAGLTLGASALPSKRWTTDDRMSRIYSNFSDVNLAVATSSSTCHGWDWFYCPRDPGCATYALSAHQVSVSLAPAHTKKVTAGQWINLYVIGRTTLKAVLSTPALRCTASTAKT